MNTNTKTAKAGRPPVKIVFPQGTTFTINELRKLNPKVCSLTIRHHTEQAVDSKFITMLNETVNSGAPGKPAYKYIRTSTLNHRRNKAEKRSKERAAAIAQTAIPLEIQAAKVEPVKVESAYRIPVASPKATENVTVTSYAMVS